MEWNAGEQTNKSGMSRALVEAGWGRAPGSSTWGLDVQNLSKCQQSWVLLRDAREYLLWASPVAFRRP